MTNLAWNRPIGSYTRVQRAMSVLLRNRRAFAGIPQAGCLLNIGCGPYTNPKFCNVDWHWSPGVVCWDVTKGLPFPDGYAAGIFTEHMLEHFDHATACSFLCECFRVMQPGGTIRVIVPDGEIYITEYMKHRRGEPHQMPYWDVERGIKAATPIHSVDRIARGQGHKFLWDGEALCAALTAAGFSDAAKVSFGTGRNTALLIDTPHRAVESLYVEAIKP